MTRPSLKMLSDVLLFTRAHLLPISSVLLFHHLLPHTVLGPSQVSLPPATVPNTVRGPQILELSQCLRHHRPSHHCPAGQRHRFPTRRHHVTQVLVAGCRLPCSVTALALLPPHAYGGFLRHALFESQVPSHIFPPSKKASSSVTPLFARPLWRTHTFPNGVFTTSPRPPVGAPTSAFTLAFTLCLRKVSLSIPATVFIPPTNALPHRPLCR